jgi:hypothetical protein
MIELRVAITTMSLTLAVTSRAPCVHKAHE